MVSRLRAVNVFGWALGVALLSGYTATAQEAPKPVATAAGESDPAATAAVAEKVAPSLVRVEYTLQFDKGEPPAAGGWNVRCPNCGEYHGNNAEQVVKDDRPFEVGGFLLADDTVITADPLIHPRFVKKIAVRFGGQVTDATPAAYAKDQTAVMLKLAKPLKGAEPLSFDKADKAGKGPYLAVTYTSADGDWQVSAQPVGGPATTTASGRRFIPVASYSLIVDKDGNPIGMSMKDELPLDDSWKGSPTKWPAYSAEEAAAMVAGVRDAAKRGLLRVTLNFRSPKARGGPDRFMGSDPNDQQNATLQHAIGVLLDDSTVLVLRELKASVTARLEKVRVQGPDGKPVAAKFRNTLSDYGAFVVTLDKPLKDAALPLAESDLMKYRGTMLGAAQVHLQGEKRVEYYDHRRIAQFNTGWRRQLYPELAGEAKNIFLFDPKGALIALPVARREKDAEQQHWGRDDAAVLTPATYVAAAVADPGKYGDPGNVPLSEQEENRIAWLGIELQALTPELARANDVAHLTNDGRTGALVTHVYPESPAGKAGIEAGDVLVRVHVPDRPKPMEVTVERSQFGDQPFPWDQYDQLPEQYFDQVPQPWPPAENTVVRMLTDLGFGKTFTAEFARGGKGLEKQFTVEQSPAHYDSAERYKSDPLGVTVRNLTYEVRRYFQRGEEEPGVIISKIEMGSKASTAGLKPFEMVTHVNDVPVKNVKEFAEQVKGQKDLRLSIKRMTKGRQVKVKLAGKGDETKPAKTPSNTKPPAQPRQEEPAQPPGEPEAAPSESGEPPAEPQAEPSGEAAGETEPDADAPSDQ